VLNQQELLIVVLWSRSVCSLGVGGQLDRGLDSISISGWVAVSVAEVCPDFEMVMFFGFALLGILLRLPTDCQYFPLGSESMF